MKTGSADMKIVIDAMGGDNAPEEVVRGTVRAARKTEAKLCLVGDQKRIEKLLKKHPVIRKRIEIVHAEDVIDMDEHPGPGLRKRKKASMVVASQMVREGEAQAFVCAGNTGALHQIALLEIGRLRGIRRPALAALIPTEGSPTLALDMGANADCKPEYLLQFAVMGSIYAEKVMGVDNPRIGLLNIGTEEGKGSQQVVAAYELLQQASNLNFVGNIEPLGFFAGDADVVVCDGFVGNMMLKTAEAVGEWIMGRVKQAARKTPVAALGGTLLRPSLKGLRQDLNHSDHGGAVLLGLRGVVVKCHGRANGQTILNGIRVACLAVERNVVGQIEESLAEEKKVEA